MSDPFVAEIRLFSFTFAPTGWALCNGQILPISQNTALFSLLGTTYGGDGKSTFALPNLQGNVAMHAGSGSPSGGLSPRFLGQESGVESVTLLVSEIPVHTHQLRADSLDPADLNIPNPDRVFAVSSGVSGFQTSTVGLQAMSPQTLSPSGGGLPHNNMQPYLVMNYCIALQGIFPARP